jgi:quinol monooxygenase YgiN
MRIIVAGWLRFAGDARTCAEIIVGGRDHILAARAEMGCVAYNWAVDPLEPGQIHVYEEWESEEALLQHFADPAYADMREHLGRNELTGFHVQLYTAAGVEPVYGEDGQPRREIFGVSLGAGASTSSA